MNDSLDRLIEEYADDLLDDAGFAELESRLQRDPEARERFLEYRNLRGALDELGMAQAELSMANAPPQQRQPLPWGWGRLVAVSSVAATLALLLGLAIGGRLHPSPTVPSGPGAGLPGQPPGADEWVAVLAEATDAVWSDSSPVAATGQRLQAERYDLVHGEATLAFRDGALLNLDAGTRLQLIDGGTARLLAGRVSVQCDHEAVGFSLLTPAGEVIDLGTKFGVSVGTNGTTDIHVFEGMVEFTRTQPDGTTIKLLEKGDARRALPDNAGVHDVPLNPQGFRTEFHLRTSAATNAPDAQLLVSETFDYPDDELGFASGGTGWKTGWNRIVDARPSRFPVVQCDGNPRIALGKHGCGYRRLAHPLVTRTRATTYLSVVIEKVATDKGAKPGMKQFLLRSTEKQSRPIGFQIIDDVVNVRNQAWRQGGVLERVAEGTPYRLVGKLTLSATGEEQFEATMLSDTEGHGEPLIWPVSLPLRSKEQLKYDYVSIHSVGASTYHFDDIRIGNSWVAVTSTDQP
jgi:ferric-dicitrate binding protein FerR (iron transport regulator)